MHPLLDTPGCFGCKISSISFGAVPGGTLKAGRLKAAIQQREKGLVKYAERRKAGEQPDGTTLKQIEDFDRRMDTIDKMESTLREDNPPEVVDNLVRSNKNQRK